MFNFQALTLRLKDQESWKKKRQEKAAPKTPKGPSSRKNIEAKMQANKEKGHQTDLGTAGKLNPKRKRRNKYSSY